MASRREALIIHLKTLLSQSTRRTDLFLTHTSRLVSTTSGLDSLLTTLFFTLTFLHARLTSVLSSRYESLAISIASKASETMLPGETMIATIEPPHLALTTWCAAVKAAGSAVENVWIFVRLFGLFRIYSWARDVWQTGKRDPIIKLLVWGRILSSAGFQVLENGAYLVQCGVLRSKNWTERERGLWVWSGRFWAADTVFELLRLARVRQLRYNEDLGAEKLVDEDEKQIKVQSQELEKRWRRSLYSTLAWLPANIHMSCYDQESSPVSESWLGLSGMISGFISLQDAWRETA